MEKQFHAIVSGKVQGVFFRANARNKANELKITGFVRNLPDGSVEIEAQGNEEAIHSFLQWCKNGPPGSRVDDVRLTWLSQEKFDDSHNGRFEIQS